VNYKRAQVADRIRDCILLGDYNCRCCMVVYEAVEAEDCSSRWPPLQ